MWSVVRHVVLCVGEGSNGGWRIRLLGVNYYFKMGVGIGDATQRMKV